jgi:hypothetical protein
MAAITVAAPSQMPSVAKHPFSSTGADTPFAASTTSRIYTSLMDVTVQPISTWTAQQTHHVVRQPTGALFRHGNPHAPFRIAA